LLRVVKAWAIVDHLKHEHIVLVTWNGTKYLQKWCWMMVVL